jgi:hypothetical protein
MPGKNASGPVEGQWLAESRVDLSAAKVLYDAKLYSRALYSLQQANEKLAKGLLISMGILTPKRLAKDWMTKQLVGFVPKEPQEYGHRVVASLLADTEASVPYLEELLQFVNTGAFKSDVTSMRKRIKEDGESVKRLRKRRYELVPTGERLDKEIEDANTILDRIGLAVQAMRDKLKGLDQRKVLRAAVRSVQKLGYRARAADAPPVQPIADGVIDSVRVAFLSAVAAGLTAVLDPLEAVTRYPSAEGQLFDEANPYVHRFPRLWAVVDRCLEMAEAGTPNHSEERLESPAPPQ